MSGETNDPPCMVRRSILENHRAARATSINQGNGGWITPEEDLIRNSLMINGEWNKVRVLAVGRKIQTWINGEQVSDLTVPGEIHERYSKGVIALQVHGVRESRGENSARVVPVDSGP